MNKIINIVTNWAVKYLNCKTTKESETDIDKVGRKTISDLVTVSLLLK